MVYPGAVPRSFDPYRRRLVPTARALRETATVPERLLWSRLRRRALGVRFLRQRPVGEHVVDFLAPDTRLVVEVDGRSRDGHGDADRERQQWLEDQGLTVLRVSNDDVLRNLDGVVEAVRLVVEQRPVGLGLKPPP